MVSLKDLLFCDLVASIVYRESVTTSDSVTVQPPSFTVDSKSFLNLSSCFVESISKKLVML